MSFFDACATPGEIDTVSRILQADKSGKGIYKENQTGRTGLMCAVYAKNLPVVTLLINAKSDVNHVENQRKYTSLHLAVGRNIPEVVKWLLEKNANPNMLGTDGKAPLHLAVELNSLTMVKLLLSYKAERNLRGHTFGSPLETAINCNCSPEIIQLLRADDDGDENLTSVEIDDDDEENEEDEEDEEDEDDEDDENDEESDEGDDNEESDEQKSAVVSPSTTPTKFICSQCERPLDSEIFQCFYSTCHFICRGCFKKKTLGGSNGPCPVKGCSGRANPSWSRNTDFEKQLQSLVEKCPNNCGRKYLPELKKIHKQHCYAEGQTCTFCTKKIDQQEYVHHLGSCLGGFEMVRGELKLGKIKNSALYQCQKSRVNLGDKDIFCHFSFTIDGHLSTIHPKLILGIHPSTSKNGWQVWLTMDTSSKLTKEVPSSLSSQFQCVLSQNFEGVEYRYKIPLSPVGYTKWAFIPSVLLFNKPLPLKLNMELIGFNTVQI